MPKDKIVVTPLIIPHNVLMAQLDIIHKHAHSVMAGPVGLMPRKQETTRSEIYAEMRHEIELLREANKCTPNP